MPLRRPNPAVEASRIRIREAFEGLENVISPADSRGFEETTIGDVRKAACEIETQLAARQSLRNLRRLMPLLTGLGYYSKSIEVACNGTPYMPWLWAPIKLILKIAVDYVECFERIVKAYAQIGECLVRFERLGSAFSNHVDFQHTLSIFYVDILQFHKQAYKLLRRPAWRVLFMTSWGRFQRRFDNILGNLKRHGELLDREAQAYHIVEAREASQRVDAWREESLARIKKEEEQETANQLHAIETWLRSDDTDQLAIFENVAEEGSKHPGTCGWILKNKTIASWLRDGPENPMVWLEGSPGSGKTVIAGQIVKFLQASSGRLIVSHFCAYTYQSTVQYDGILRSLLWQLLRSNDDVLAHVYWDCVIAKKATSTTTLERLLVTVVETILGEPGNGRNISMVIDGLDEADTEKQRRLIHILNKMTKPTGNRSTTCKVLISCRSTTLLENTLRRQPRVSLSEEDVHMRAAILAYANSRMLANFHRFAQHGFGASDLRDMAERIADKAKGMFLWARLVLDYLAANMFHGRSEIEAAVNTLPRKLAEFYEKILVNIIAHFDVRSVDRLRRILGWVAFARRPLRKAEFLSALAFSSGDALVHEIVPSYVLELCAPLIEFRRDTTLSFIHVSVKDYLLDKTSKIVIDEDYSVAEHAVACSTCLLSGLNVFNPDYPSTDRCQRVLRGLHGLHVYAHEYWADYMLVIVSQSSAKNSETQLQDVLGKFSESLQSLPSPPVDDEDLSPDCETPDSHVKLRRYPALYSHFAFALRARKSAKINDKLKAQSLSEMRLISNLNDVLSNYQATIIKILTQEEPSGLPREEFSTFERTFRSSAFTCRLPLCPRASTGFENDQIRREHEASHSQQLPCRYDGCQYPAFNSLRALKSHEARCHQSVVQSRRLGRSSRASVKTSEVFWKGFNAEGNAWSDHRSPRPPNPREPRHNLVNGQELSGCLDFDEFLRQDSPKAEKDHVVMKRPRGPSETWDLHLGADLPSTMTSIEASPPSETTMPTWVEIERGPVSETWGSWDPKTYAELYQPTTTNRQEQERRKQLEKECSQPIPPAGTSLDHTPPPLPPPRFLSTSTLPPPPAPSLSAAVTPPSFPLQFVSPKVVHWDTMAQLALPSQSIGRRPLSPPLR